MDKTKQPEVWQRGPVENIPPLLQPVAHALLQAREEVDELLLDFPENLLWEKPAGVASVGFHLRHLTGVLDRLFTYAQARSLNDDQLNLLAMEGIPADVTAKHLALQFRKQVKKALGQLRNTAEQSLTAERGVGRAQVPSTVIGILFHAAEHTMRHVGQLHVTVKVLKASLTE